MTSFYAVSARSPLGSLSLGSYTQAFTVSFPHKADSIKAIIFLQHGGVVFLYHPCLNHSTVNTLRTLAESCMLRFVLTPCEKLSFDKVKYLSSFNKKE